VKYMIVDRQMLLLTSANMQDKPNIELMVHLEGRVVDSFYNMYIQMWGKNFVPPLPLINQPAPSCSSINFWQSCAHHGPCIFHSEHAAIPMILANRLPGASLFHRKWSTPQNVAFLSAMHNAQRSLFIETPDFNEKLAYQGVIEACKRGVQVTVVISWLYNYLKEKFFLQGGTNVHVMKKLYRKLEKLGCMKNLTVCFYVALGQMNPTKVHANHTKFMAIDDEVAIFGSGNMDTQSWQHSQEANVVVDSPLLVSEWLTLFRTSQNTHLYGVISPNSSIHPVQQIKAMVAKNHTHSVSPAHSSRMN